MELRALLPLLNSPYSPNESSVHCLYSTSLDVNLTASQMTSIPSVASSRKFIRYLQKGRGRGTGRVRPREARRRRSTQVGSF